MNKCIKIQILLGADTMSCIVFLAYPWQGMTVFYLQFIIKANAILSELCIAEVS